MYYVNVSINIIKYFWFIFGVKRVNFFSLNLSNSKFVVYVPHFEQKSNATKAFSFKTKDRD